MPATQEIKLEKVKSKWPTKKLSEVCTVLDNKRKPINSTERETRIAGKPKSSLFPYYGATGQVGFIDDYLIEGEYVLLGEDGAPFLESFKDKAYIVHGKIWVNNHAHILIAKGSNKFLCYYLNQINYREFVSGTTRLKLNQSMMREIPVLDPPLPEQHRIVQKIEELFSELDYAITTLKTTQQQLQTYRQSVLKHAFEGKLTEAWRKNIVKPTNKFEKKANKIEPLRQDELIELPELQDSWQWIKIGQILDVFVGSTPSRKVSEYWEGNISWVSSGEVRNNFIIATKEKITESGLENSATKVHPPGTVLIAMIGEGKTRGQAAILKIPAAHNQNTAAIRLEKEKYLSKLLYYYFIYTYEKNRNVGSGNNQKALNKNIIENIPIPYCRIDEQEQIVTEIETRLSESDYLLQTINQQLTHAESLRQSILQRAFSGEL